MKYIIILLISFFINACAIAQISLKKIGDKVNQKVNQRIDRKTDQAIDKGLDKAESGAKKTTTNEGGENNSQEERATVSTNTSLSTEGGLKSYSKFDFIPGGKIVYAEDFLQDVVGEFPLKWNTNGSGEIVTIDNVQGRWLDMVSGTKYETPFTKKLPDNYTVEFDLLVQRAESMSVPSISFQLDRKGGNQYYPLVGLEFVPGGGTNSSDKEQLTIDRTRFISHNLDGAVFLHGKDQLMGEFAKHNGKFKPVHISVWVQKQRFRAWINSLKIYDLPRGMSPDAITETNQVVFEIGDYGSPKSNYQYYLSNIRIAEALPDTRSKLITEGKWSTNGILFETNSDKIMPGSFGVLKEIAAIFAENPTVKVKIIGHTDSDGDDAMNLDLSKRRAAAVRLALSDEFNVKSENLQTDGVGESKPVADNQTSEGKAQNRRVEFVKL